MVQNEYLHFRANSELKKQIKKEAGIKSAETGIRWNVSDTVRFIIDQFFNQKERG